MAWPRALESTLNPRDFSGVDVRFNFAAASGNLWAKQSKDKFGLGCKETAAVHMQCAQGRQKAGKFDVHVHRSRTPCV